ncbi:universal stress protein [Mycobacteroides abscessus subsp. abscessus]|jgi:nucleotide-binding universal stress UspA family protein|nr:universal stress protein [Mycobacteroides abscessus subsp. abscessus]
MYKKILFAFDGSENSLRAAIHAVTMARMSKDSFVTIVHVVDGQTSKEDVLHYSSKEEIHIKRKQKLEKAEVVFRSHNVSYEVDLLHGEAAPTIVDYANSKPFDLVVVGSRGLNGLQEMVLGSVSHKVAKRVSAPVLIVK